MKKVIVGDEENNIGLNFAKLDPNTGLTLPKLDPNTGLTFSKQYPLALPYVTTALKEKDCN